MKRLKKLGALLLACLILMGTTLVACAAETDSFSDVSSDAWYADAVAWCKENGIMSGTSETAFSPDTPMTRAMLATVLHRAAGEPVPEGTAPFSDVSPDTWYAEAVAWAAARGLVTGYGNGRFGTDDPITREQLAAILWRSQAVPRQRTVWISGTQRRFPNMRFRRCLGRRPGASSPDWTAADSRPETTPHGPR